MHQKAMHIPFGRKVDKMAIKIPTFSIAIPSKIYPNWDLLVETVTTGNTGLHAHVCVKDIT
jgi:hypothetical protein